MTVKRNILHAGYEILYLPFVKLLSISTFFYMKKEISCDSKNLQYGQLAYYRILLPFHSSHTVSRLAFLILCRTIIARAHTPESKCVAVGEFARDIGISFKVDMDLFVLWMACLETRGVNRKKYFW